MRMRRASEEMAPRAKCARASLESVTILGGVGRCVRASAMATSSAVVGDVVKMVSVLRGAAAELRVTATAKAL